MESPYENLPPEAFWRTGVVGHEPDGLTALYKKRFAINPMQKIATAGSCFAQHIARHLRARGYSVLDVEPPPPGLSPEMASKFGYGIYSGRYGNVYTARQLKQLAEEVFGLSKPSDSIWEKDGRYYDALRPSVEPEGLSTPEAVADQRKHHLAQVRELFTEAEILVFTLGLTEAWVHRASGTVFPTAPGTIAGKFDRLKYEFRNFSFMDVYNDMCAFFDIVKAENPGLRFLLTVSPVPLTATATGRHVLYATTYSKAVLRAVAGQLYQERDDVEYFPSYEIITSPLAKGRYFESNLRQVKNEGVEAVMKTFFAEHEPDGRRAPAPQRAKTQPEESADDEVVCEEALLEAFAR
jgi:GSCFA family